MNKVRGNENKSTVMVPESGVRLSDSAAELTSTEPVDALSSRVPTVGNQRNLRQALIAAVGSFEDDRDAAGFAVDALETIAWDLQILWHVLEGGNTNVDLVQGAIGRLHKRAEGYALLTEQLAASDAKE
jgi:hypothetical protein